MSEKTPEPTPTSPVEPEAVKTVTPPSPIAPGARLVTVVDAMLKFPESLIASVREGSYGALVARLIFVALVGHLGYGLVVGLFAGGDQLWVGPLKIAGSVFLASAICLPSLYILASLGRSEANATQVAALLSAHAALSGLLLIGFAPVAWVFSQSTTSLWFMGLIHLSFGLVCFCFGLRFILAGLHAFSCKTKSYVLLWILIFAMTSAQMMTSLRPIIAESPEWLESEKKFFLVHWGETFAEQLEDANRGK